jgi:hypothetical protein
MTKAWYQDFFWVLIDLMIGFLGLIIKAFDNQTEIWAWLSSPLIIKLFEKLDDNHDYFVHKTFTHKARSKLYSFGRATWQTLCRTSLFSCSESRSVACARQRHAAICCSSQLHPPLQLLHCCQSTSEFLVIKSTSDIVLLQIGLPW